MKNKIPLIIRREYLTRVKKKSFIIMTILAPLLFAGIMIVPIVLQNIDKDHKSIAVVDESGIFSQKLENTDQLSFAYLTDSAIAKKDLKDEKYDAVLTIQKTDSGTFPHSAVLYYAKKQPGLNMHKNLEKQMQTLLRDKMLTETFHIAPEEFNTINKAAIKIQPENIDTGESGNVGVKTAIAYVSALLIYMFVFLFGVQIMNGVIEEKTNRIVEVIISSVRPFQLMLGKIIGVALVGLTQFALWIILTFGLVTIAGTVLAGKINPQQISEISMAGNPAQDTLAEVNPLADQAMLADVMSGIQGIDWTNLIIFFLIYFIGGYLLYASLFAAIGSAVDNEADTQQFTLPITVPLIIAIVAMAMVMENPNGPVAFWFSIIPFTSPVIMMMRIPFGVPAGELALSISLLIAGFIFTTWLAAKIYRVGILMYGKKITYSELWKWMKYKNA